jgi:CRP-like cAMP-binding protein
MQSPSRFIARVKSRPVKPHLCRAAWSEFTFLHNLSQVTFLHNLSEQHVEEELIARMTVKTYHKGEYIVRKDTIGTSVYFVDVGHAQAVMNNKVLTDLTSGMIFGEVAFLASCKKVLRQHGCNDSQALRLCDVIAVDLVRLVELTVQNFLLVVHSLLPVPVPRETSALNEVAHQHENHMKVVGPAQSPDTTLTTSLDMIQTPPSNAVNADDCVLEAHLEVISEKQQKLERDFHQGKIAMLEQRLQQTRWESDRKIACLERALLVHRDVAATDSITSAMNSLVMRARRIQCPTLFLGLPKPDFKPTVSLHSQQEQEGMALTQQEHEGMARDCDRRKITFLEQSLLLTSSESNRKIASLERALLVHRGAASTSALKFLVMRSRSAYKTGKGRMEDGGASHADLDLDLIDGPA